MEYICVCAKNGKNISNPLSFCNIYYIYRTYTYLLSFQVRQRHVQFNCLLTRDKIEFHESPFEENSERLYITSYEYVPSYNIVWFVYFVRMITQNFVCIMKKRESLIFIFFFQLVALCRIEFLWPWNLRSDIKNCPKFEREKFIFDMIAANCRLSIAEMSVEDRGWPISIVV